jgi:sugar lactone lactonase YvrE
MTPPPPRQYDGLLPLSAFPLKRLMRRFPGFAIAHRLAIAALACVCLLTSTQAGDLLVADRLSNSVYRYSESGTLLGTVLADNVNLNQPTGLALSPDLTKLYVASFQNSQIVAYDYNLAAGTASNPTVFAAGFADNLATPSSILFSQDGSTMYVSNLGGTGVARFNLDGSTAGPPLQFAAPQNQSLFQFSGLAFAPDGKLLVGAFQDFPAGTSGAVGRANAANSALAPLISPATSLNGASGLLVHGDDLYVTGMFASNIQRFDANTGAHDPTFSVTDLAFPQGLLAAPDGNGLLVGILGVANGAGHIARYDFDGALLGTFAATGNGGFTEATAFIAVPDLVAPAPGVFNNDQTVDGDDLAIWKSNFGNNSGSATVSMGDADANGKIDGADFLIWQRNFTAAPNATVASVVPEPSALILAFAIIAVCGLATRGRKPS